MLNIFAHMITPSVKQSNPIKATPHNSPCRGPSTYYTYPKMCDATYQIWSRTVQRLTEYGHLNYQAGRAGSIMKYYDMHNKVHLVHSVLIIHHH